jgi:hypothetical protein
MNNILYLFLTFSFLIFSTKGYSSENSLIRTHSFTEIHKRLLTENIISKIPMEEFLQKNGHKAHFTNPVYFVELTSGLKAVFKLAEPHWMKPSIAEVAAFKASEFLRLHLVPPTTLHSSGSAIGSLQQYVEPSFDLMKKENYENTLKKASPIDLANIALFYFVFGQWDPDPSNMIAVERESQIHLRLIDNGAMGYMQKVRYGEHPFVHCFPETIFPNSNMEKSFPFAKVRTLSPHPAVWQQEFGSILSEQQIKQLCRLRRPVTFIIWKGRFYRQYRFGTPSYTSLYPKRTMQLLAQLTLKKVKSFFRNDLECTFSEEYFQDILERRDQVLAAYKKHKHK